MQGFFVATITKQRAPAARPRVATTGTVGINLYDISGWGIDTHDDVFWFFSAISDAFAFILVVFVAQLGVMSVIP